MSKKGFTLVELAIVLVIIGLLVGGVLQGQELIKQAQVRNVISRFNEYDAAVNTFRSKYDQLPGDFAKANAFGVNKAQGSAATDVAATPQANGDGDNNGFISDGTGSTATTRYSGEIANFWAHLSNMGLIKGSFIQPAALACAANGGGCVNTAGAGFPDVPIGTGVMALSEGTRLYWVIGTGSGALPTIGKATAAASATSLRGDNLTPEEAYAIDGKLDNGTPDTGAVQYIQGYSAAGVFDVAITNPAPSATTCTSTAPYVYNVSVGRKLCTLRVRASS